MAVVLGISYGTIANAAEIKLKWQPNAELDLAGYNLYFGNTSRNYGPPVPVGKNTSYTIKDLDQAQVYYFALTALDTSGNESGFSAEASKQASKEEKPLPPSELTDNLVALWLMDETQGTTLTDASGNGHDGTLAHNGTSDNPLWQNDAAQGSVLALDGAGWKDASAGNYVDLGNLDVNGDQLSIGVMFKASSLDPYDGRLITKQTGAQDQDHYWMLSRYSKNALRFRLRTNGTVSKLISGSNLYATNEWVLAVATYDGSQMKIYCNGQLVGSMAKSGSIDTNASIHAFIGAAQDGSKLFTTMDGQVAYAFVYDRALSQDEIKSIHTDGKSAFGLSGQTADTTPPLVTITSPTRMDSYETDQNSLKLVGEAQDSNQVSKVTWKSSNGGAGTADGTTNWSISGISLSEGENTITIMAVDAAGNEAVDHLMVVYRPLSDPLPDSTGGLVALWLMDETQGTTLTDASGNGHDGTLGHNGTSGNPLWQNDAAQGSVLALDGAGWKNASAGNYVDLGNLDLAGEQLSIGVMFKASSLDPYDGRLITKQTGVQDQDHYWMLSRYSKNSLRFRLRTNGSVSKLVSGSNLYATNEWVLAVATYDGSQMKIYCNGQLVGSMAKSGSIDTNDGIHAFIGAAQDGSKLFTTMDGQVAYAFVYDRALSQDEIGQIYHDGLSDI